MTTTTWRRWLVATSVLAPLAAIALGLQADDKEAKKPKLNSAAATDTTAGLAQAALAAQLALEGEQRRSPLLLLAAAELLGDLKQSERALNHKKEGEATKSDKDPPELRVTTLVDKARIHAKGNDALLAVVERFSGRGLTFSQGAGRPTVKVEGLSFKVIDAGVIDPGKAITLTEVTFDGAKPAAIAVVGDGDGDLDLWVYDGNSGGSIGSDTDSTSRCLVRWVPLYTGPFTVRYGNVGAIPERYLVLAYWDY